MLTTIMTIVGLVPEAIKDGESAYAALMAFLASPAGQDVEANLGKLFTHVATPGSAVVIEPIPTVAGGKQAAATVDPGVPETSRGR